MIYMRIRVCEHSSTQIHTPAFRPHSVRLTYALASRSTSPSFTAAGTPIWRRLSCGCTLGSGSCSAGLPRPLSTGQNTNQSRKRRCIHASGPVILPRAHDGMLMGVPMAGACRASEPNPLTLTLTLIGWQEHEAPRSLMLDGVDKLIPGWLAASLAPLEAHPLPLAPFNRTRTIELGSGRGLGPGLTLIGNGPTERA